MFSILIPTWNNLEMLKLCVRALRVHSHYAHQIILHINEGSDGTRAWADAEKIDYTWSEKNIGICTAVNQAFGLAKNDFIVYMNDDMYALPNWDLPLVKEIISISDFGFQISESEIELSEIRNSKSETESPEIRNSKSIPLFMLSGTMIEPFQRNNDCQIVALYGRSTEDFQEERLLREYKNFVKSDWSGACWPPNVVSRKAWLLIGGFSIEFSPGMYSDPDFAMKLWSVGCRIFRGIGDSRVYHFQARSTGRVKKNNGRVQFMQKWRLPASAFFKYYLRMGIPLQNKLEEPINGFSLKFQKLKARFHSVRG